MGVLVRLTLKNNEILFRHLNKMFKSTLAISSRGEIENDPVQDSVLEYKPQGESVKTYMIPKPNFSMRNVDLPPLLKRNMIEFCRAFPKKQLLADGRKLSDFLKLRHKSMAQVVPSSRNYIRKYLFREELKEFEKKPRNYKMVLYGERESVSYLSSMSPQVFAANVRVLNELKLRYRDFRPTSILDFGSGTGMTIWAANQVWNNVNFSVDCIEPSRPMVELAKTLMNDKENPNKDSIFNGINFSPFFYKDKMYDVVVTSFSLTEFPHYHTRKTIIKELWKRTRNFLVVIDHGNWNGFKSILAARQLATTKSIKGDSASIVSPCPHIKKCPRTKYAENNAELPCSFSQYANVAYSEIHRKRWNYSKIPYSFIILRKGGHGAEFPFYRILDYPMRRSKHIICHFCTPDGNIEKHVFTKRRHKEAYSALRFDVNSGDELILPKDYPNSLVPFNTYGKLKSELENDVLIPNPALPNTDAYTSAVIDAYTNLEGDSDIGDDDEIVKDDKKMLKNLKENQFISLDQIEDFIEYPDVYDEEKINN